MNSAFEFLKIWKTKIDRVKRMLARLPRELANEALAFTVENFNRQQTPDGNAWSPRKNIGNSRALLVRTGRLRKSIRIRTANENLIRIGTDVDYAKYIQQGTPKMVARPFLGSSEILKRRLQRLIQRRVANALN